ncbi:ATP-binding protein [Mycolicibacterium sp. XJ870]
MTLKQPTKARYRNLQLTHSGGLTATYFVDPLDYGLRPPEDKESVQDYHESLALAVPDHTLLLGVQAPLDLVDVLHRTLDQVDLERHPDHIEEAVASYHRTAAIAPTTRIYTATLPLGKAPADFRATPAEFEPLLEKADRLIATIDPENTFKFTPVPEGLLAFLWNHHLMRGAALEVMPRDPARAAPESTPTHTEFRPGVLDEGARSDKPWWRSFDPILKAMVRLDDGHVVTSYQSMLIPASFPTEGMWFPGGCEFLTMLDGIPDVSVDWAMRVRRTDREAAMQQNEKTLRKIGVQLHQRDLEVGFHSQELQNKVRLLAEYNAELAENENAEEINFTTVLAVGATNEADMSRQVATLKARFRKLGIKLSAPRGCQRKLWHMFNPGAPADVVYGNYEHLTSSRSWGGLVPFTTARLLDDTGPIIGVNLLSGQFEPLHFNFLGKALRDTSPAIAVAGELGAGKSYFVMTCGFIIADLGGQFLAIDRSRAGEYVPLVNSIPNSVVIDLGAPEYTWDPLQIFSDPVLARRIALDTILPLLNIPATSAQGKLMSKLLRVENRSAHGLHTLADLRDHCARVGATANGADSDDHRGIADAMDAAEAPVLFGRGLPPMPMGATATVVRTHTLSLPKPQELTLSHAYANLPWRKRLGHTLYELVGLLAREQFMNNRERFGALIADEAYHFTTSTVGQQIVEEFVRDGRKTQAGIILASHDPKADYAGVALDLVPNRFGFRHRDRTLAENTLEWLGADIERDRYLVKQLRHNTSPPIGKKEYIEPNRRGECFIADGRGRIGRGKILGPAREDRAAAIITTPNRAA